MATSRPLSRTDSASDRDHDPNRKLGPVRLRNRPRPGFYAAAFAPSPLTPERLAVLLSMTGFGEARRQDDTRTISVEVRSVNGRHLKRAVQCAGARHRAAGSSPPEARDGPAQPSGRIAPSPRRLPPEPCRPGRLPLPVAHVSRRRPRATRLLLGPAFLARCCRLDSPLTRRPERALACPRTCDRPGS